MDEQKGVGINMDEKKNLISWQILDLSRIHIRSLEHCVELMNLYPLPDDEKLIDILLSVIGNDRPYWSNLLENARVNISYCSELTEKLEAIIKRFENEKYVQALTHQYLHLVSSEFLQTRINELADLLKFTSSQNYINTFGDTVNFNVKNNTIHNLTNILQILDGSIFKLLKSLAQLDTFEYFKNIEHSVVIVGANGSGKSSFSRNTKKVLGDNIAIISAQKIFTHQIINSIPLGAESLQNVRKFQSDEKLGRDWSNNQKHDYGQDLYNLMLSLTAEHNKYVDNFYSQVKNGTIDINSDVQQIKGSVIEEVINIWKKIITHRCMRYKGMEIKIHTYNGETYDFPNLSDGEKAVFYYIAHILLAKENSFIIVDEPENHLHVGVVSKLWDTLENRRADCKFIYLTHNLDFAASRVQATKLWSQRFIAPATWDVVPLPKDEDLPESLLMELLGSRKKILFCEGAKSSLDYKLYTLLFKNYTIKPVGGHLAVISYTRAFNKSNEAFNNTAIGIIDGDFHLDNEKSKWEEDSIYCIDAQEIENVLCDEALLKAAGKHFFRTDDIVEKAKEELFNKLEYKKIPQAVEYATQKINSRLRKNFLEKSKNKDELEKQFKESKEAIESINIDTLIKDRVSLFDKIILDKDYDEGVRRFNHKGLIGDVANKVIKEYKRSIFGLLEKNPDLLEILRNKYFSKVPLPENNEPHA